MCYFKRFYSCKILFLWIKGGNMIKGKNERLLYEILNEAYPDQWVSEHKGIEGRKFRFDCANPTLKIAIEIEGGLWITGRHNQPLGMIADMEKYNLAVVEGWKVLRYAPETIRKCPWKLIADVRKLCGESDEAQQTLSLDGLRQTKLEQVQVRLS
jgi:hypothetical protein